jgi:hypothetical protein
MRQQGRRPRGPTGPAPGAPRRRGAPEPEAASPEATSPPPANMDNEMLELMNEYFYGVRQALQMDPHLTFLNYGHQKHIFIQNFVLFCPTFKALLIFNTDLVKIVTFKPYLFHNQ